jgi:hypothetical protein
MTACTIANALRGGTGSGTVDTGAVNASFKFGIQGLTGPTSYDITTGSTADFSSKGFTVILGAVPIADTGAAASIIRFARYQPASAGAPATGTVRWTDGAAGANVETPNTTALNTVVQTWLVVGT